MLARPVEVQRGRWVAVALTLDDAPAFQSFLDAHPLYAEMAFGRPWLPIEAASELSERPPADMPYEQMILALARWC